MILKQEAKPNYQSSCPGRCQIWQKSVASMRFTLSDIWSNVRLKGTFEQFADFYKIKKRGIYQVEMNRCIGGLYAVQIID